MEQKSPVEQLDELAGANGRIKSLEWCAGIVEQKPGLLGLVSELNMCRHPDILEITWNLLKSFRKVMGS